MALQNSEVGIGRASFSYDGILNCNFNPLNAELSPICHLLALLGAHHILHVSGLRVNRSLKKTGNVRINVTSRRVCVTIVAVKKAVSVTYHECVFVALGIEHAMRMRHSVICGLPGSLILFDIIS
jgi:hypothetical protein